MLSLQTLTPRRKEAGDIVSGRLSLEGQSRLSGADSDDYGLKMRMDKLEKYNKTMKEKIEDLLGAMEEKETELSGVLEQNARLKQELKSVFSVWTVLDTARCAGIFESNLSN